MKPLLATGLMSLAFLVTAAPIQVSVGPRATFLHTDAGDTSSNAIVIDLTAAGFLTGQSLHIQRLGGYTQQSISYPDNTNHTMLGVFSSSASLGSATADGSANIGRVLGAIDAGSDYVTTPSLFDGDPTDIPEDFLISDENTFASIVIPIPAGAQFLFVGTSDSFYSDNADQNGDFAVRVDLAQSVPEPSTLALFFSATIAAFLAARRSRRSTAAFKLVGPLSRSGTA